MSPLSALVRDKIAAKSLTTVDAALLCGIPKSTMYAFVQGERGTRPTLPTLRKLADGLEIPYDDLLAATGYTSDAEASHSSQQAKALLRTWQELNARDQHLLLALAKSMKRI